MSFPSNASHESEAIQHPQTPEIPQIPHMSQTPQLPSRPPLRPMPRVYRTAHTRRGDEEQEIEAEEDIARLQETIIDVDALVQAHRTGYPYEPLLNIDTLIMRPSAAVTALSTSSAHQQAYELRELRPSSSRSSLASGRTLQVHPGTSSQSPSIYSSASEPSNLDLAYPAPTANSSIHRGLTYVPALHSNTSFDIYDEDEEEIGYEIANDNDDENDPPPPYTSHLAPAPPYTPRDRRNSHAAQHYNKKHRGRRYRTLSIATAKRKKQLGTLGVCVMMAVAMAVFVGIPLAGCVYFSLKKIPVRYLSGAVWFK
ncbi:uncharacterized protein BDV14DRAFT_203282 [Aspergillus stella-maris]|uniref:uncharacterized protein n=1 Tax=Aspergillus stella-maris TaxID=1810926 RepID=UPI003CCDEFCB